MKIKCDSCGLVVPVKPHYRSVSVAHVGGTIGDQEPLGPCLGNRKRQWQESLMHLAVVRALQYAILDTDTYWELS